METIYIKKSGREMIRKRGRNRLDNKNPHQTTRKSGFREKKQEYALAEHADMCQGDIQGDNVSILASENQFF